ncbi:MAG: pca operon transcription factor PcaQ [Pigmentiphaga sp.]|uniref:pca operon transcription factor PcaQ n=1 Tax=Pigmentiphaga sp. TaxID=1977564 RepID=UPI0029BDF8B7|nr:pca operon transcription factor PcaQ [Pigmentiphaga sp.]MDX3907894.1 pca operon transcription factor PcaQ [Pigmentiphaga sp.]
MHEQGISTGLGRIKLRHLQCLVAIAAHRHMGQAAEALGISQPAVSKTLAELEDVVQAQLVIRSKRGVWLTEKGQVLLRYAGSSLRTLREGLDHISSTVRDEVAVIAIGTLPTVAPTIGPMAASVFKRSWPSVRLSVHTGVNAGLLALLRRGELDLVLGRVAEPSEMLGLSYEHLYEEPVVMVARPGHPLAGAPRVEPAEVAACGMVLPLPGTAIRRTIDSYLVRHGVGLGRAAIETLSDAFARAYVAHTDAVWMIALGVVEHDLRAGSLVQLACDTSNTSASVGLTLRSDSVPSHAVKALIECIRAAAALWRKRAGDAVGDMADEPG